MRRSIDEINRLLAEAGEAIVESEPAAEARRRPASPEPAPRVIHDHDKEHANAAAILDELQAAGIRVEAREGRLRLLPASRVEEALAARVRLHKPAILALLASRPPLPDATETWLAVVDRLAAEHDVPPDVLAALKAAKAKWR
jgi:hypothetical protein